jgi:hypothetical protein
MNRRREQNLLSFWQIPWRSFNTDQSDWIAHRPPSTLPYWIALAAGVALFLELAVARWHATLFPVFGFYKSVSLLSALLGLGIGFAVGKRRPVCPSHTVALLALQLVFFFGVKAMSWHHALRRPIPDIFTGEVGAWADWFSVVGFFGIVYVLNALTFVSLGQMVGGLMSRVPNLPSYRMNLLGAAAATLLFFLLGYLWAPPGIWFGVALMGLFGMMGATASLSRLVIGTALAFAVLSGWDPRPFTKNIYSPYQLITVKPGSGDERVAVSMDHLFHENIFDLSGKEAARSSKVGLKAMTYDMPYQLMPQAQQVLVVGAGTGNDVAAALRRGVAHVDAVESDPAKVRTSLDLHPEKPFQDARVSLFIDDPRAFMNDIEKKYDIVSYALLDSPTLLANRSNVRMDSWLYTVEGLRAARELLSDKGLLALNFSAVSNALGRKLFAMLQIAFDGETPVVLQPGYDGGALFLAGPGAKLIAAAAMPLPNLASHFSSGKATVAATDDWPYFFAATAGYPFSYAGIALSLMLLSIVLVRMLAPQERRATVVASTWFYFFLGAAGMLLQARVLSGLNLLFGNTWETWAVVGTGAFALSLFANEIARAFPRLPIPASFAGVATTLIAGWWLTGNESAGLGIGAGLALYALPLFFSSHLFSSGLRESDSLSSAICFNLFGTVCGGLLAFHSMVFGYRALALVALALYLAAATAYFWKKGVKRLSQSAGKVVLRKVAASR